METKEKPEAVLKLENEIWVLRLTQKEFEIEKKKLADECDQKIKALEEEIIYKKVECLEISTGIKDCSIVEFEEIDGQYVAIIVLPHRSLEPTYRWGLVLDLKIHQNAPDEVSEAFWDNKPFKIVDTLPREEKLKYNFWQPARIL